MSNALEQFELHAIVPLHVGSINLSLTNSSVAMIGSAFFVMFLFWAFTRNLQIIPKTAQSVVEVTYGFIANMIRETIGDAGLVLLPFILSLFLFILFGNMLGLAPYAFTFTSHLSVVGVLAIIGMLLSVVLGVYHRGWSFLRVFFPEGIPWPLAPLIIPIEIISFLAKPFSLTVRLVMNMFVGHIMLEVIAGFVVALGLAGLIPLLFVGVLIGFEAFIAFLQAYIYTILTCIYLREAFAEE